MYMVGSVVLHPLQSSMSSDIRICRLMLCIGDLHLHVTFTYLCLKMKCNKREKTCQPSVEHVIS